MKFFNNSEIFSLLGRLSRFFKITFYNREQISSCNFTSNKGSASIFAGKVFLFRNLLNCVHSDHFGMNRFLRCILNYFELKLNVIVIYRKEIKKKLKYTKDKKIKKSGNKNYKIENKESFLTVFYYFLAKN